MIFDNGSELDRTVMLKSLGVQQTRLNQRIKKAINANYQFRRNYERMILGKDALEYKRTEWDYWMPTAQFGRFEGKRVKWLAGVKKSGFSFLMANPVKVMQEAAFDMSYNAELSNENATLEKLMKISPVKVIDVQPLPTVERTPTEAQEGEICYVCLGADAKNRKHTVLPGYIESIHQEDGQKLYNLLVIKANVKTEKIVYHGRHLVFDNEIGRTPKEAVQHLAFSQIIY